MDENNKIQNEKEVEEILSSFAILIDECLNQNKTEIEIDEIKITSENENGEKQEMVVKPKFVLEPVKN